MKELFVNFLNVSISGSLIIAVILLLRVLFRKAPKALTCVLWLLVFTRLCLPVQLEVNWSVRPETPVLSAPSGTLTEPLLIFDNTSGAGMNAEPQLPVAQTEPVDAFGILAAVWALGVAAMLLYTLVSYLRLKHQVKEGVLFRKGVYEVAGLDSAFLLGYFVPQIFIPMGMDDATAELVIAHEKAHIRRLDNWLKLLGFVTLAIHWFNPLVWISYILLCRDVEEACDEAVIRNLAVEERKEYSEALLACGKKRSLLTACPLAFGEISIGQRIKSVLNYRKPTLWVCIVAVLAIVLVGVFFMTDPVQKHPPYYEKLMNSLGEPISVVCEELDISESDLVDELGGGYFYNTPLTVEYRGVPFDIQLVFERGSGLLSSYRYVAEHDGLSEESVNAAGSLWKHLVRVHGKGYQWELRDEQEQKYDFSADRVRKGLEDPGSGKVFEHWDLTKYASKSAKTYLDQIQVSSVWHEAYGDSARKYRESPHFYLQYNALYYPHEDKTVLILEYNTGWQPGHYTSIVTSDYDWG